MIPVFFSDYNTLSEGGVIVTHADTIMSFCHFAALDLLLIFEAKHIYVYLI